MLFELIKLAPQGASGLLAHRTATRLMRSGASKVGRGDEWVARFAGMDGDLHEVLLEGWRQSSTTKLKRPGAVRTRAVDV